VTAVILILTLMSLIIRIRVDIYCRNSFDFTILVRISADAIRIVYEMRLCADILSGNLPDVELGVSFLFASCVSCDMW